LEKYGKLKILQDFVVLEKESNQGIFIALKKFFFANFSRIVNSWRAK